MPSCHMLSFPSGLFSSFMMTLILRLPILSAPLLPCYFIPASFPTVLLRRSLAFGAGRCGGREGCVVGNATRSGRKGVVACNLVGRGNFVIVLVRK